MGRLLVLESYFISSSCSISQMKKKNNGSLNVCSRPHGLSLMELGLGAPDLCSNRMCTTSSLSYVTTSHLPFPITGAWTQDFRHVTTASFPLCVILCVITSSHCDTDWSFSATAIISLPVHVCLCTIHKHTLITKSLGQSTCREMPIAYDPWPYPSDYSDSRDLRNH